MASGLLIPIDNPPAGEIVRAELYCNAITGKNADKILPHAARNVRQSLVLVFQLHLEHGVGQRLDDRCHYFNRVFLRQTLSRSASSTAGSSRTTYCVKI